VDYRDEGAMERSLRRGVEHRPAAESEVAVLLFEPAGTLNAGDVRGELTAEENRAGEHPCL
jgi:hypothetical protein